MRKAYCTAIILAAGQGRRMGTKTHKQYLDLAGKPVLYYSLKTFQDIEVIDEIILVVGPGEEAYCREQFVDAYDLTKVSKIICGGKERYHSVWNALQQVRVEGYTFIHDGARPFVDAAIIRRTYEAVQQFGACVAAMPVKDTIKIVDEKGYAEQTLERRKLWLMQTPQVFETVLIKDAYTRLMRESYISVTDDAAVAETMLKYPVKMVYGSYENIKITTPEDLAVGELFLARLNK